MVKQYAPATLDTIRQRVSLEQAAEYLHLSPSRGRYFCPFCQPTGKADHHTPDMGISNGKGFHCFKCGKSGSDVFALVQAVQGGTFPDAVRFVADLAGVKIEAQRTGNGQPTPSERQAVTVAPLPKDSPPPDPYPTPRPELLDALCELIEVLPGSPGEEYLQRRGFSLSVVGTCGLGYASPTACRAIGLDKGQPPPLGRVIFPHFAPMPDGGTDIISLYGRAIDTPSNPTPKELRHRHLPGPKGFFRAASVRAIGWPEPLVVCEGPFDALAVLAAGWPRVLATYGVGVSRLDWLTPARSILIAFDADTVGQAKAKELAAALRHRGVSVSILTPDEIEGKDVAESFALGQLNPAIFQAVQL